MCIFLLGCCGDINHVDVFRPFIDKQYREISEKLSPKVISAIKNGEVFENPELSCISEKVLAYKNKVTDEKVKEHIKAYCEIEEEKDARIYLTYMTGLILKIGAELLGIQMPDKM